MDDERGLCQTIISKCLESGIRPEVFLREKMLELEERKRVLLTPTKAHFADHKAEYSELASSLLQRALTDEEKYDPHDGVVARIERRMNPEQREGAVDLSVKHLLLRESNHRCTLCGEALTITTMCVDHKLPLAEGGSNHTLNLQALCATCNQGKSDWFETTAQAAARPWYEPRSRLIDGKVRLTPTKRFCVLTRDGSQCQECGATASETTLRVVPRVSPAHGGQLVYDNLLTRCEPCAAST